MSPSTSLTSQLKVAVESINAGFGEIVKLLIVGWLLIETEIVCWADPPLPSLMIKRALKLPATRKLWPWELVLAQFEIV